MAEQTVWLACLSEEGNEYPVHLGVAATEHGAWRLCEVDAKARSSLLRDGEFVAFQYNEKDGERWAWPEFTSGAIYKWRAYEVERLHFSSE